MEGSVKLRILEESQPYLQGKWVKDLIIGLSLVACQLSDGSIGVAYVLREGLPPECGAFGFAEKLIGAPAGEAAALFVSGEDNIRRAVGNAVITAAASCCTDIRDDDSDSTFGIEPNENDTVGMVGLIKPVAAKLRDKVGKLVIFDSGVYQYYGDDTVLPDELQGSVLPQCNKLIITGSSTINGSIDELIKLGKNAEKLVIVGSSTPMLKKAWQGTAVTALAGTCWKSERKEEIFRAISLGGGISSLKGLSAKKLIITGK